MSISPLYTKRGVFRPLVDPKRSLIARSVGLRRMRDEGVTSRCRFFEAPHPRCNCIRRFDVKRSLALAP